MCLGLMMFSAIGVYALGFWYGSVLIQDKTINDTTDKYYTAGDVLKIFFAVVIGAV